MKIFGKNPVFERIKSNPDSIRKVYVQEGVSDTAYLIKKAKKWGFPLIVVPKSKMQKLARNVNAQGIMIDVEDFVYEDYADVLAHAKKKKHHLVFLDGLNDPQNFGAILRTLACFGHFSVVIPKSGSVQVTEAVCRIACGGENYVPIAKVTNLSQAIESAKEKGYWILGTVVKEGKPLFEQELPNLVGVVIGSEEKGIRQGIRQKLDYAVTIPMLNERMSFNAAHAATILAYEVTRQNH